MANPIRSVFLNDRFYNFTEDSWHYSLPIHNTITPTYGARNAQVLGASLGSHTITLHLDSIYYTKVAGVMSTGTTTWPGLSRLYDMFTYIGAQGPSMPIRFVTPYGVTINVIPTGTMDVEAFNPSNPSDIAGMEFRVSLTLEEI